MVERGMLSNKKLFRVLVVDDHPLVREGLGLRIDSQPDMEICGEAASESEAMKQVKKVKPHLLIVDIALENSHGIDLIKQVKTHFPKIKMLVVSAFEEDLYAERAMRAGAHGYINKREVQVSIIDAIRTVLDGNRYLSSSMTQRLVAQAVSGAPSAAHADPIDRLSDRELEVFELVGRGRTTGDIARQLHVSVHTVDSHREHIRHKLMLQHSTELTRSAVQWVLENGQQC